MLRYRDIACVGYEQIPARGPCVVIMTPPLKSTLSALPRAAFDLWQIRLRERGQGHQTLGRRHLRHLPHWPMPFMQMEDQVLQGKMQQTLERGGCLVLMVERAAELIGAADILLGIETATGRQLGVTYYCIEAKVSQPIFMRRDLWARMHDITAAMRNLLVQEVSPQVAKQSFAQIMQDTLLLYRGFTLLQSYENPDMHDQILLEQIARLRTLRIDHDEAVPIAEVNIAKRWLQEVLNKGVNNEEAFHLRQQVGLFWYAVSMLGIKDRGLFIHRSAKEINADLKRQFIKLALLLPVGFWGVANHYVIYKIPQWWQYWTFHQPNQARLLQQISLPLVYLVQYLLFERLFGSLIAFFYLLSLPLTGWLGVCLVESRPRFWRLWQFVKMRHSASLKHELLNLRWAILELGPKSEEAIGHAPTSTVQ